MTTWSAGVWSKSAWVASAALALGCQPIGGDDNGARLDWEPGEATRPSFAVGAEARVSIVDDCTTSNPFNSCSHENVVEIVSVEVDETVLEVTPAETGVGDFRVLALAEGETQLFIAARFDDETEAMRSADAVRKVAVVDGAALVPGCRYASASAPWLVPASQPIPVRASLRSASPSDGELFHHDVDWSAALQFPAGGPSGLDGASRSPADLTLTFSGAGIQRVLDEDDGAVTELSLYAAADVSALEVAPPPGDPEVGEKTPLTAVIFVDGAAVCVPLASQQVSVQVEDGTVCSLDEALTSAQQKRQPVSEDISVFAHGEGTCRVTVELVDTALSAEVSFPVSAPPPEED